MYSQLLFSTSLPFQYNPLNTYSKYLTQTASFPLHTEPALTSASTYKKLPSATQAGFLRIHVLVNSDRAIFHNQGMES